MNKLIALLTCAVLFCATSFLSGCASEGSKKASFKTLRVIGESVDKATQAFTDATAAGAIDAATVQKVRDMHEQYRVVFDKAVVAAQFQLDEMAPAYVAGLAAALTALIASYVH